MYVNLINLTYVTDMGTPNKKVRETMSFRVAFDGESHGNLHVCSISRRYTVLKQTPRTTWHAPVYDATKAAKKLSPLSILAVSLSLACHLNTHITHLPLISITR